MNQAQMNQTLKQVWEQVYGQTTDQVREQVYWQVRYRASRHVFDGVSRHVHAQALEDFKSWKLASGPCPRN